MKLLAVDSSAKSASVAVFDGDKLISECYVNTALTHSCTLLPMVDNSLKQAAIGIDDIDSFAVNNGPGSFTGIRIGVSAVKGLAFKDNKPCIGISSLESIAYNFTDENCTVCACMDARCNQVYTAVFNVKDGLVTRISQDEALSIDVLKANLSELNTEIYLAGDGAQVYYDALFDIGGLILPAQNRLCQRAYGTGLAAIVNNKFISPDLLKPTYLRPPQAERELKIKHRENSQ